MNWLFTFIVAIALVFCVPVANNFDAVKVIVEDIKSGFEREISIDELKSQLAEYFTAGSMEKDLNSTIPEFVFDISSENSEENTTTLGVTKHDIPGINLDNNNFEVNFEEYTQTSPSVSGETLENVLRIKNLLKKSRDLYLKTIDPEKLLELATEVYYGDVFNLVTKNYNVTKNKVDGWTLVAKYPKDKEATESGTTARLWVNNIDNETYCISIAGTDSFDEILFQYIPMETSPGYASQQRELADFVNNINDYMRGSSAYSKCGKIKKLLVTGHSLGGFLAMTLGTDLYDSTPNDNLTIAKRHLLSKDLKPQDIKTITFAAPGLLEAIPSDTPKGVKDALGVGDEIPEWSANKFKNNKNRKYDNMLVQYTNNNDLVSNLQKITDLASYAKKIGINLDWIKKFNFVHLGMEYSFTSKQITLFNRIDILKQYDLFKDKGAAVLGFGALLFDLEHHQPYQYDLALKNKMCKLTTKIANSSTGTGGGSTQR